MEEWGGVFELTLAICSCLGKITDEAECPAKQKVRLRSVVPQRVGGKSLAYRRVRGLAGEEEKNEAVERKFYSLPEVSLRLPSASAPSLLGLFLFSPPPPFCRGVVVHGRFEREVAHGARE